MNKTKHKSNPKLIALYVLVALATGLYIWFVVNSPVNGLTEAQRSYASSIKYTRLVLIPGYVITWVAGVVAISNLTRYVSLIKGASENAGLKRVLQGLSVLTIGIIAWPSFSAVRATIPHNPEMIRILTYVFNYMMIVPTLAGFYLIYKGSQSLLGGLRIHDRIKPSQFLWFAGLLVVAPLYIWLIFTNPIRNLSPAPGIPSTFYLPDGLIVATIVCPAFLSWIFGILATIRLGIFKDKAPGVIYKKALPPFYYGLAIVIVGELLLQAIVGAGTGKLFQLGVPAVIIVVNTFNAAIAAGFVLIARATHKLAKIETI